MPERRVLVLGAGGFIGRALVARLGAGTIAATRRPVDPAPGIEVRVTGTLTAASAWRAILEGAHAVVHLASRAHAPPGADLSWIEQEAAAAAAFGQAVRAAGIGRVVLLSSIKIHGEDTRGGAFRASDPPAPADAYGRAKLRIEESLRQSGVPLVVLRPPLVFGPGVKGNFRALLGFAARGVPLPLASVANRRSLIFLDHLVDLIETALTHERAVGGAFLMREARDVSTPELLRLIAQGLGRTARLLPCPPKLLSAMARTVGRSEDAEKLLNSLCVDDSETRERLGWRPRLSLEAAISATCRWYAGQPGAGKNESMRPMSR
ncbi:MAG TPA: NAD-dependent epimerase/dehydratase family protein, partial [Stellaceae bacterium]|nr:NAD-dependent epimerase/dehydratase family protein [Stellaceae bacterium]